MKQAVIQRPGQLEILEVARPEPGPGEFRVRSVAVGICGSDLHAFDGHHPFISLPVVPGHEVAGIVDAAGPGAEGFQEGDRVLLEPNLVCGRCFYCTSGRYNLCEQLAVIGCQTAGGLAEAFVAPGGRLHAIPEGMSWTSAALVEPLSTATHATRLAGDLTGAAVAVLGSGSIGLLTMLCAKAAGAAAIATTDPLEEKRQGALELGATAAVDPRDPDAAQAIRAALPHRPDVVFDCVASETSLNQAIGLAEKGGTVIVIGVPRGTVSIPLPIIQDREIRIQGSAMYVGEDVLRAIKLLAGGVVDADRIVTDRYPLEQAAAAFAAARLGSNLKVHVSVGA
jgi:2-desacetyl-2-hydroxyethyl bacteriochlorophyllide A dehydrogenase